MRFILFLFLTSCSSLFATSQASFPKNIKSMVLVKQSIIPGKDVVLPKETPLFLQETVSMYNWINNGKGTKLNIYIPKNKLKSYASHGPYADGITSVAIYEDQNIIFVTEHLAGQPLYGVYDRKGKDLSGTHPSLSIKTCYQCHEGHADICKNGTCAVPIIGIFKK
ncbi:hypothetical protein [Sulfuricurvum sp.]|uniref:hypothetical protein n=1 Tax=Sulfuricurvum sp. TaxID=2025608 RepID=UPI002E346EF9|nr:hypothetical protein [Sulfuricurvum sp.]HEX5329265.1 hypothetical protein [Sulfuricurvum sp.]